MDVENLDALTPAELEALLEQALNPQVPVSMLYAVLERIGAAGTPAAAARPGAGQDRDATSVLPAQGSTPHPPVAPRGAATDRAVRPERPLPPKGPNAGPSQQPRTPNGQPQPAGQRGHAPGQQPAPGAPKGPNPNPNPNPHGGPQGDPNGGVNGNPQGGPQGNPRNNPNAQPTAVIPVVPNGAGANSANGLPPSAQPTAVIPVVPAAPPARAAHAPARRPGMPGAETGR